MTPAQAARLREIRYRELLEERYGPLNDLEAERDGPTPKHRRRGRRLAAHIEAAVQRAARGTR